MSYTYLLEPEEESSAECFSDIAQYVQSKLNLTADPSCFRGSETEYCPGSQSGTMSKHSMAGHGAGLPMSYVEDSHARTLVAQGGGAGLAGDRSGLWAEMARVIGGKLNPPWVELLMGWPKGWSKLA